MSREFADRAEDVEQVDVGVAVPPLGNAGTREDQRHANAVLVAVLFAHQPVLADGETVVAGEHDQRVVGQAVFVEGIEHPPELVVEVGDHRVVLGDVPSGLLRRTREPGEQLVADQQRAVVERVAAEEVGRQVDLVERIHVEELLGHGARIVGREQRDIGEERLLAVALAQVVDHGVAENLARVDAGVDVVAVAPRRCRCCRSSADRGCRRVACRSVRFGRSGRPARSSGRPCRRSRSRRRLEAAVERLAAVVPLARAPGVIALGT